jgi:deoxyribose-phosphate aldolase
MNAATGALAPSQIAKMIDHALLRPELTSADVLDGCGLAARHDVGTVCVKPVDVAIAHDVLAATDVLVGTVIAFPHGSVPGAMKAAEAEHARENGARELDMVLNVGRLRSGEHHMVAAEIAAVVAAAAGATVKVILETAYLTDEEKIAACRLAEEAGAAFVKTSTGFASSGATLHDVKLMRDAVSRSVEVKAAGGVRSLDTLLAMFALGATRFGTSSTEALLREAELRKGDDGLVPVPLAAAVDTAAAGERGY